MGKNKLGRTNMVLYNVHIIYYVFGGKKVSSQKRKSVIQKAIKNSRKNVIAVNQIHAIKGISFSVRKGETVALIGSNGAGKSTILRAMAGVLPYVSGSIYSKGQSSLLGVNAALMPALSGEKNIILGCLALGLNRREIDKKFDEIVKFAGIGDFIHLPMTAYSSGMAARLRFAISVSKIPDILMIDEALATGDAAFQAKSQEKINEIKDQAGTVFLVAHNNDTVRKMCKRTIWLDKGKVVMDGSTNFVLDAYEKYVQYLKSK